MEYERALFRVYDRSLESLRADQPIFEGAGRFRERFKPTTVCMIVELLLLSTIALSLLLLTVAHSNFVGANAPRCLHSELKYLQKLKKNAWIPEDHPNKTMPEFPLLSKNDLLQIRVGNKGTKELMQDREVQYRTVGGDVPSSSTESPSAAANSSSLPLALSLANSSCGDGGCGDGGTATTEELYFPALYGAGDGEFEADYRFTLNPPLMYLSDQFTRNHHVEVLNVTLSRTCLTKQDSSVLGLVVGLLGYDDVMINQVFDAVHSGGVFESQGSKEQWGWTNRFAPERKHLQHRGVWESILFKLHVLVQVATAFFFIATTTAIVVRMLISSGVVVMFPLFTLLQALGVRELDMHILTLSYPWLGLPVELMRRQRKPTGGLICAHAVRVVVLYSMYEACQIAWSLWLYDKPLPDGMQLEVYALVMIWEYYSMIFLRSAAATYYLPKFTLLYFCLFHVYFYATPYGFFNLALMVCFLATGHALLASLVHFEVPASERLEVTFEHPRAYFVELPWPSWHAALPPSWTLFMPLNARPRNIYDDQGEEQEPVEGDAGNNAANDAGGGGDAAGSSSSSSSSGGVGAARRRGGGGRRSGDGRGGGTAQEEFTGAAQDGDDDSRDSPCDEETGGAGVGVEMQAIGSSSSGGSGHGRQRDGVRSVVPECADESEPELELTRSATRRRNKGPPPSAHGGGGGQQQQQQQQREKAGVSGRHLPLAAALDERFSESEESLNEETESPLALPATSNETESLMSTS